MRKATRNYLLALFLFLIGLADVTSGLVLWLVLPSGRGYAGGRAASSTVSFLFPRGFWLDLHIGLSLALVVLVAIHVTVHWKWIVSVTKQLGRETKMKED